MHRIPRVPVTDLTPEQDVLVKSITGGKRGTGRPMSEFTYADGSLRGPFNPWLQSPDIGERAQRLGESLRFDNAMPPTLRELAIITVAKHWRAQYEWFAHAKIALKEGLAPDVVGAVMAGTEPPETEDGVQAVVAFVKETLETGRVSDATYAAAHARLGNQGTVDLVTLIGYYCMVSATLNVFQVPLLEGETPPFQN